MVSSACPRSPAPGGIDAEVAGIVMAGAIGGGVAKPLLLPHLLEQAGGHAAGWRTGAGAGTAGVGEGQAGEGQGQVVLLDGLFFTTTPGT